MTLCAKAYMASFGASLTFWVMLFTWMGIL